MNRFAPIRLDSAWRWCVNRSGGPPERANWQPLDMLEAWPQARLAAGAAVYLKRTVVLEPTEVCVRYLFQLETAPDGTQVFVNGWQVGAARAGQPLMVNVTDQVALGDNEFMLRITQRGRLEGITLQAVPCE